MFGEKINLHLLLAVIYRYLFLYLKTLLHVMQNYDNTFHDFRKNYFFCHGYHFIAVSLTIVNTLTYNRIWLAKVWDGMGRKRLPHCPPVLCYSRFSLCITQDKIRKENIQPGYVISYFHNMKILLSIIQ